MKQIITEGRDRMLLEKWGPMLKAGDAIESDSAKLALAKVFENTYKEFKNHGLLTEAGMSAAPMDGKTVSYGLGDVNIRKNGNKGVMTGKTGYTKDRSQYGDFYMPNLIMPMLRRIFPTLIANELVGVQPLNAPLGYALAYRAKYGKNGGLGNGKMENPGEIGFNPVDTRWTGVTLTADNYAPSALTGDWQDSKPSALTGAMGDETGRDYESAWEAYVGKKNAQANYTQWTGAGADLGAASEYASFSEGTYPTVGFDLIKQAVEAKTRKLGAAWSPELAEDMENMHGLDVEAEMINIISYELGAEIDRQIVTEMVRAAITGGSVSVWSPAMADGLDQMGRLSTLLTQITIEANQIALKTRRGNANFVVASPRVCALLEQLSLNKFVSIQNSKNIPSVPDSGVGAITKTGMINDGAQLLVRDAYAPGEYVLMGYKGSHPADSGIVYCPYIPIQMSKVLNPDTLTPQVGCRTRYGIMSSPWDSKNYYHFIQIDGLTAKYQWGGNRQFVQPFTKPTNGTLFV